MNVSPATAEKLDRSLDRVLDAAFSRADGGERESIKLALILWTDALLEHHAAVEKAAKERTVHAQRV